uniref:RING-type E3 ubiquitin transferase n=1 Tax=Hirondellea gigas TaxID=1518452 RepID=A0A6A7FSE2_9CRUS
MSKSQGNNSRSHGREVTFDELEGLCVICFCKAEIYSVGECDHPVCYVCSTRMRVLIQINECPICRKEMAQVVFMTKERLMPYRNVSTRTLSYERRYSLYFENDQVMSAYDKLLHHPCPVCPGETLFGTFLQLKDHVQKHHQLYYCELCLENLKIFSRDRRAYTRSELATHRRKGDVDDRSHRGHPLCEFCDTRFMDQDELYKHLRKDHFYCHFCDADGFHNYYDDYPALQQHFAHNHFLCEEGDCRNKQFTNVFRNKLDMQAHYLEQHADTKQAIRLARTVDIEFTVNHGPTLVDRGGLLRGRGGRGRPSRGRGGRGGDDGQYESDEPPFPPPPPPQHSIDINCVQDFPSLVGTAESGGSNIVNVTSSSSRSSALGGGNKNTFTVRAMRGTIATIPEQFPVLGKPSSSSINVTATTSPASNNSNTGGVGRGAGIYNPSTTSVHLKVNSKKGSTGGSSPSGASSGRGGQVSIQYSRISSASPSCVPNVAGNCYKQGKDGSKETRPQTQVGNITLKSRINNASGNKENSNVYVDPFPSLGQPSKSLQSTFGSYNQFSSSASGPVSSTRSSPLNSNVSSTKVLSVKTKDPKSFEKKLSGKNDFPSLLSDSQQNEHMKNYQGMSTVTVPVNNSWTKSTEYIPKSQAISKPPTPVDVSASSKANKKKKGNNQAQTAAVVAAAASSSFSLTNGNSFQANKKRPLRLNNVFEESDDEEQKDASLASMYNTGSRRNDDLFNYTSHAPESSSSVRTVSADAFDAKRKSELKIGSLKAAAPALSSFGDFPSLGGGGATSNSTNSNNVNKKKNNNNSSPSTSDGWSTINSIKKNSTTKNGVKSNFSNTDMTFHNSYGESFSISPSEESNGIYASVRNASRASSAPSSTKSNSAGQSQQKAKKEKNKKPHEFLHPPNFEKRNQQLIKTISEICGGNTDKFNRFKALAGSLRSGGLGGREYYQQCRQLMGRATMLRLLPELLVLLPDIGKQQAVYMSYKQLDDDNNNNSSSSSGSGLQFRVCESCNQVLSGRDFEHHMAKHGSNLDSEFPSLRIVSASLD